MEPNMNFNTELLKAQEVIRYNCQRLCWIQPVSKTQKSLHSLLLDKRDFKLLNPVTNEAETSQCVMNLTSCNVPSQNFRKF